MNIFLILKKILKLFSSKKRIILPKKKDFLFMILILIEQVIEIF